VRIRNQITRGLGLALAIGVLLAGSARAQLKVGENTDLTLTGDLGFGYGGSYGNLDNSSHGTGFNGDGSLTGYYYNPRFLNFNVSPIYNRSQANSGEGSITDATNIGAGVNIFSGSHFPGAISFGEAFSSSGNYGFGTTPGYTTTGNSHGFGVGWSALVPGAPPLSVQYSQTASASTIFGTSDEDHSAAKNLNMFSNYKIDGWYLGARFTDSWTHTDLPSLITEGENIEGDTNTKIFNVNGSHKLPLRGNLGTSYAWSDFSGSSDGTSTSGSNQSVNATASFWPVDRFSSSFQVAYNSNLSGAIEQQLAGLGAVNPEVNLGVHSYSIALSNFDNVVLTKSLSAGLSVGHTMQRVYGETVSSTHASAVLNWRYFKPLWGTLVIYAGANDQATEQGNQGAGLVAGANFSKQWSNLDVNASFGYGQDVQTILATKVTSTYDYSANVSHYLTRRMRWYGNFNGFHTGLGQLPGSSAHAEGYSSNVSYKMYNLGASYSHSTGTALLTANGLVLPPGNLGPALTGNQFLLTTGSAWSLNTTMNPVRLFVISANFTKAISDSSGGTAGTNSNSKIFNTFTSYQFRKVVFSAGYSNLKQYVSASGQPPGNFSNFYVGIQRWFRAF